MTFDKLKLLITSTSVFVLPDQTKKIHPETDTSVYATGAVLSQLYNYGKWRLVGFVSKSLFDAECNYAIHDKELLSIICGLEEWHHILEETKYKIEILHDHQNSLISIWHITSTKVKHAGQSTFHFYFKLIHHPGHYSAKADALSRHVNHKWEAENNQDQTLLPPDLFHVDAVVITNKHHYNNSKTF